MKKITLYIAFAFIAMASCTVETEIEKPLVPEIPAIAEGEQVTIHLDLGGDTKTVMQSGGKVYWSPGDQVIVEAFGNGTSYTGPFRFTSTNTEPSASADFVGTLPTSNGSYVWYHIAYPASPEGTPSYAQTRILAGNAAAYYLPSEQRALPGTFAPELDCMAGYSMQSQLDNTLMYHVAGGIKFSVNEPGITKITLKAHGGEPITGTIYSGYTSTLTTPYDYNSAVFSITLPKDESFKGFWYSFESQKWVGPETIYFTGDSEIVLTPESGTFVPGEDYYFVMRPTTMETGFSLFIEKGNDWGTRIDINKSVQIRRAEFRTLQECDKDFDWDNTVLTFSKDQFYLGPYSGGFSTKVVCPGPYTIDQIGCDWLQEVDATDWDQPIYPGWAYMITSPEEPGGDARFDGCNHVFALKANYGPERSTTVTFRHKGQAYPITVTQGAGDWLPNIKRTHFGCVFHTMDENMWDWKTDKALSGYLYNKHGDINHADGARLEYVQGAYGNTGSEFPAFVAGQYLWAQNLAIGDNPQFGTLAGDVNLNNYVYDYTNDVEPELYSDSFVPIMEKAMDEIDEYYIPTTTIAVTANECKEDTREIDVTVEVFAAKAGTYRLTGLIVERQVTYIPGGLLFAVSPSNHIIGYVTDYRGEEITFESDNSTKTVTLHAEVVPECTVPSDWHAPMVAAGYGRWSYLWMVFFTAEQFGTQVQFRMKPDGPNDYYVDNCLYVKFNTTYDHDGGSHEQASVDPGFDPNYPGWSNEDQW